MAIDAPHVLIVDDDQGIRTQLRWALDSYEVHEAADRRSALQTVRRKAFPVVILDLGLPPDQDGPTEGLRTLTEILSVAPATKIIVMTGQSDRAFALEAVQAGAYDFHRKPLEVDKVSVVVDRAIEMRALEEEIRLLTKRTRGSSLPEMVCADAAMLKVCDQIEQLAKANISVLLVGESGTGKELLARACHLLSHRKSAPYVAINCAAIPDTLMESEFFGHEKGAFTGAHKTVVGKVEYANKGTILLDEIGDLPHPLQAKLLRFLQERVIERVGGRRSIPVDVRIVSATNRDPRDLIKEGAFREDLYYRLSEVVVEVPPLRDRPSDIIHLARHFAETHAKTNNRAFRGFTSKAISSLTGYTWPGNVRELENYIKRAIVTSSGPKIDASNLQLPGEESGTIDSPTMPTLREARESAERTALVRAMAAAQGNISKMAEILDTSRPTIYQLLKLHKLRD